VKIACTKSHTLSKRAKCSQTLWVCLKPWMTILSLIDSIQRSAAKFALLCLARQCRFLGAGTYKLHLWKSWKWSWYHTFDRTTNSEYLQTFLNLRIF
jgi:hypothetical protein